MIQFEVASVKRCDAWGSMLFSNLQFEINNIDYDLLEYMLCELRRWQERRERRVTKTGLVRMHSALYTKMRVYFDALRQIQRDNLLGLTTKKGVAVQFQRLLDYE